MTAGDTLTVETFVTTSWDDGHGCDMRLAELLKAHNVPGTFYVAPQNSELAPRDRLSDKHLLELVTSFEIGGHTLNHVRLGGVPAAVARHEIAKGKDALEQIVGSQVRSFCYPGGSYRSEHRTMVKDAGFTLARTVRRGVSDVCEPFECHTTVHAYRHLVDGPTVTRLAKGRPRLVRRLYNNWDELAILRFDRACKTGGIFHLWGHSWEVDERGDWARLERVLKHIGGRPGIRYVTNGDLPTKG